MNITNDQDFNSTIQTSRTGELIIGIIVSKKKQEKDRVFLFLLFYSLIQSLSY